MSVAEIRALLNLFQALKREAERIRDIYERKNVYKSLAVERRLHEYIYNLCVEYNNAVRNFKNIALKYKVNVIPRSIEIMHAFFPEALDTIIINSCLLYTSPSPRDRG